ncbi:MAG: hypothetical protein V4590_13970 [Bacteroidota bacterium]
MKSFFYYQQLIKHYGSATLIDVLHSPFVFALYNDCIKKKGNVQLPDFTPQSTGYLNQRGETILDKFKSQYPNHLFATHPAHVAQGVRFIFMLTEDVSLIELQKVISIAHNESVIIVKNMYDSPISAARWKAIKHLEGVTASVDLFVLGFVFVRKEQRKQEFKLRIL